jgi:hypothetical protein
MDTEPKTVVRTPQVPVPEVRSDEGRLRRVNSWLIAAVVVLTLAAASLGVLLAAEVDPGESDQGTSGAVATASAPAPPVSMPEGTWVGAASSMFYFPLGDPSGRRPYAYSIEITIPAECAAGERCGGERLISSKGDATCAGALQFSNVSGDGKSVVLDESWMYGECSGGSIVLTPKGSELLYGRIPGDDLRFALRPADSTP